MKSLFTDIIYTGFVKPEKVKKAKTHAKTNESKSKQNISEPKLIDINMFVTAKRISQKNGYLRAKIMESNIAQKVCKTF